MAKPRPEFSGLFGAWPSYSKALRRDMDQLLAAGGGLTAYRSNPDFPVGPREGSWAWRLERKAEERFSVSHAIACSSGTMALQAALFALNLPAGEVVTTPYTFSATVAAILWAGLTPVFADVDPRTGCLDPKAAKAALSKYTVALLPVDLFGLPAPIRDYREFFDGAILEDACQAVGAMAGLHHSGALGDVGVYSFNGTKNVPAGEAGMVVTAYDRYDERARLFLSHGENWPDSAGVLGRQNRPSRIPAGIGLNGRLNEPTALIAWHGLRQVERLNRARVDLLWALRNALPAQLASGLPWVEFDSDHALYVCPWILPAGQDRAVVVMRLGEVGVEAGEGYIRPPLHLYPAFRRLRRVPDGLPTVTELSEHRLVVLTQVRPPATARHMRFLAQAMCWACGMGPKPKPGRLGGIAQSAV